MDQMAVSHVMRKAILKAFSKEKIEIPFPTRTVFTRKA
jgi:small-conductance mechanosensitive channel